MCAAMTGTTKKRGSGRGPKGARSVHLRLLPDQIAGVEDWIAAQPKPRPSRAEAIRHLLDLGLAGTQLPQQRSPNATAKAHDLAGQEIDKVSDPSATTE